MAVPLVMIVRDRVSFIDRLMSDARFSLRSLRRFSRMRSEMMTVSCTEKPTTVSSAATVVRSNSMCAMRERRHA